MKKKIIIACIVLILAALGAGLLGLFPVARVGTAIIWYRAYDNRAGALERFEERNKAMAVGTVLTDADRSLLRRSVLQSMIAETVMEGYIKKNLFADGLPAAANALVESTLKTANPNLLPRATKELYGWSVDEFKKEVLYPQALQNVLQARVEKDGGVFSDFLAGELGKAQVRLYGVPWKWENGALKDK